MLSSTPPNFLDILHGYPAVVVVGTRRHIDRDKFQGTVDRDESDGDVLSMVRVVRIMIRGQSVCLRSTPPSTKCTFTTGETQLTMGWSERRIISDRERLKLS